ncbi:MAG: transcription termination factor Rho, partial [Desulfurobacterium sp.]
MAENATQGFTIDQLQKMSIFDLRKIAKSLGIDVKLVKKQELVRRILEKDAERRG